MGVVWGTTDDFTTSFLHFSLFSAALWDLANARPVYCQMLSTNLFFYLPCLLPPFAVPCKIIMIIMIKEISTAPIFHTEWKHRALYNSNSNTYTPT